MNAARPPGAASALPSAPASCCVPGGEALPERIDRGDRAERADPQPLAAAHPRRDWCEVPAANPLLGNDGPDAMPGDGEGPVRRVALAAFRIGATVVTNAEFAAFVRATGHVTEAERADRSFVFFLQLPAAMRANATHVVSGLPWWVPVAHACWQRPEGAGSHVHERQGHPVVHVSWQDAQAYGAWAGVRLPVEAEWEAAARGGLEGQRFPWGDALLDGRGVPRCNVFRGEFPNAPADGWRPEPIDARAGEPNGYGLFNVCGNVWEWCADSSAPGRRGLRGGSFLCHDSYCNRYRVAARSSNDATTSASNIGFRVCGKP